LEESQEQSCSAGLTEEAGMHTEETWNQQMDVYVLRKHNAKNHPEKAQQSKRALYNDYTSKPERTSKTLRN
jgi:hypothetical protein